MFERYAKWLHTGFPAGTVERSPEVNADGTTRVPGLRVAGDLLGVPLLKMAADSGARSVDGITPSGGLDLIVVGAGVAGVSAARAAIERGCQVLVLEAARPFSTIHDFPVAKPIFTYPTEMKAAGVTLTSDVKESLVDELEAQRAGISIETARVDRVTRVGGLLEVHADEQVWRAPHVLIAVGKSGDHRRLRVPGEDLPKVSHRLFDPHEDAGKDVLVVGGGDSAVEAAVALDAAGARTTLVHRGELARPKRENVEALGRSKVQVLTSTTVRAIGEQDVELTDRTLPNDRVYAMVGREAPLELFRRSGIPIRNEWTATRVLGLVAFLAACWFVYLWKAGTTLNATFAAHKWFPFGLPDVSGSPLGHVLGVTLRQPGFWYSLLYSAVVTGFGVQRILRRRTPYITLQTSTLIVVQVVPLFLLPYFVLPALGAYGAFEHGMLKSVADALFPTCNYDYGREYWRAFGLVLAWPLFFWNVMNSQPLTAWLVISFVQTFVIVPLIVWRWGKGAYCGWICSCGALAETVGDRHREKMPHGKSWNRLNLLGQAVLLWSLLLLVGRALSWLAPGHALGRLGARFVDATFYAHAFYDYYHLVDMFLAGILGVGLYFWFSGRTWCRFACPLAALMHVYARLGRFRIFADKKRCISCNVCTSVCHQGIDVMSFANKGQPMTDPECVRCSACVQSCPTGVLSFGRTSKHGPVLDTLVASPVQLREGRRLKVLA